MSVVSVAVAMVDCLLSPRIIKGHSEQLAYARALAVLLVAICVLNLTAVWALMPDTYQLVAFDYISIGLMGGSTLPLLLILRFSAAVKLVAILMCLITLSVIIYAIYYECSTLSPSSIWLLPVLIMSLVFVGIAFCVFCSVIVFATLYFTRFFPEGLPVGYENLQDLAHAYNVVLMFSCGLLLIVVLATHFVVRHLMIVNKEKSSALEESNRMLQRLSYADKLTGLFNRHYYDDHFPRVWAQGLRYNTPMTVMLLDVDFFKQYNDNYGHVAGDKCLAEISKVLTGSLHRLNDTAYRWGGDEFLIVLSDADANVATMVADNIRRNLDAARILNKNSKVSPFVTLSIGGVSVYPDGDSPPSDLLKKVDQELYKAKSEGRDKACLSSLNKCPTTLHAVGKTEA